MTQTFEEYLIDKHASQYIGIDDDMGEDCGDWLAGLDTQELIDYAEKWHKQEKIKAIEQFSDSIDTELIDYFEFDSASEAFRGYLIRLKAQLLNSKEDNNAKQD